MALSSRALCTLADVKTELSISDASQDTRLERLIEAATRAIEQYCARPEGFHYESARVDVVQGFGTVVIQVPKTPLLAIASIIFDPDDANETITATLYAIDRAGQGRIYRESRWRSTMDVMRFMVDAPLPGTEQRLYQVTYTGGFITQGQVAINKLFPPAAVTITRSGTTATVSHTAHRLLTGNEVAISGATPTAYNGVFSITKVDADSYTFSISQSPATPATGDITSTTRATLPHDLEDACIQLASMRHQWAARNPSVASEKLLSWSASYKGEGGGGMDAGAVADSLDGYRRLVIA